MFSDQFGYGMDFILEVLWTGGNDSWTEGLIGRTEVNTLLCRVSLVNLTIFSIKLLILVKLMGRGHQTWVRPKSNVSQTQVQCPKFEISQSYGVMSCDVTFSKKYLHGLQIL